MVGMPLDPTRGLARLAIELPTGRCSSRRPRRLLARLGVSLRGLDARSDRPDAWSCCATARRAAPATRNGHRATIYGRETAVIDLDLSGMTDDSSISTLLGPRRA